MINVTKPGLPLLEKYVEYLQKIWDAGWLTNDGELLRLLEQNLEESLGVQNIITVCNGALGLHLVIKALGIKGEVITTPFSFATSTNVIVWEGCTPVFADIDPYTFNIDPEDVENKITENTTAILAVHVYGNPCDVDALQEIASRHNLKLIYDAAHAFGVKINGDSVLTYGDAAVLSFHATKFFHTIEGGAVIARDQEIVEKLKLLRNHGIKSEFEVPLAGTNAKMNEFQAAMGLCNLDTVAFCLESRRRISETYKHGLPELLQFQKIEASTYNYSYMPVLLPDKKARDGLYEVMIDNGIKPRKYFYPIIPDFGYLKTDGIDLDKKKDDLTNARDVADRILCLPIYPELSLAEVEIIIGIADKYLRQS